ncbi:MAG: SDR family oxidoreductase [Deltaproteobacteria bacterium]|nr:SDR family oxidoreductase [Deltaproteobacteria bacterium]
MTQKNLDKKIALVTGGTTGIGLATAHALAEAGADVIVTGRNPETLAAARAELDGIAEVIRSDAADPAAVAALFDHVKTTRGRLDVLFLNAGIARFAPLSDLPIEDADTILKVNVLGPWLALKHATPLLSEGASVVVNTSVVHTKGLPGASIYAASKAALRSIVRVAAAELAPRGVRVNAVSPGPIETPIYGKLGLSADQVEQFATDVQSKVALGRFGRPEDIAHAVLYLASPASAFVTGTELPVDGGFAQV